MKKHKEEKPYGIKYEYMKFIFLENWNFYI